MKSSIFLSILLISSSPALAFERASVSERLVEKALYLLEGNRSKDAVELFTQASFADPLNKEAVEGLVKASLTEGVSLPVMQSAIALEDLNVYLHKLMNDKSYYVQKISLLKLNLLERGVLEEEIFKNFPDSNLSQSYNQVVLDKNGKNESESLMQSFFILNEYLTEQKKDAEQELAYLKEKYQYLRDFNVGLNDLERREWRMASVDSSKNVSLVKGEDISLSKTEIEMIILSKSMEELQKKVALFEGHLEIKTQKVVELTQQVINLALQLAEKDVTLSDRVEALSSLQEGFEEMQSRFELGQRLIQQKDNQIEFLATELDEKKMAAADIQQRLKASLFLKDQENAELQGTVSIYKDHLTQVNEQLKIKQADLTTMEDQLALVQSKLIDKNKILQKTSMDIAKLEQNFDQIKSYLASDPDKSEFAGNVDSIDLDILKQQLTQIQSYLESELQNFNRMNTEILLGESYLE